MRAAAVAVLVAAAFALSGCQYLLGLGAIPPPGGTLDPGIFASFDPGASESFDPDFDPGFSPPPPLATYTTGSATVKIGKTTSVLDRLSGPGVAYQDFGTEVAWTDGKGLFIRYFGSSEPGVQSLDGFVSLDKIAGGQHWASANPLTCTVKITQEDAKALVGTATCKAVRWADTMARTTGAEPPYVVGEAPFDAAITFRAAP